MEQPARSSIGITARCLHQLRLFFVALQYFTQLPAPRWVGFAPDWLQHAARYFPAVGIVVGLFTAAAYALSAAIWPQPVAVLLSTAFGIYLTGAFHEDGFADACDGLGGGMTAQRALEIMRDSRIGSFGAIGIVMLLALKCLALSSLPSAWVAAALMLAHPASRLASAALIWRLSYVRGEGKAKPLAQQMSDLEFGIAAAGAAMPVAALGWAGWVPKSAIAIAIAAGASVAWWLARLFMRRIGGYTGDCLGAVQQLSEAAIYLGLLACVPH